MIIYILTYIRGIIHWFWIFFFTVFFIAVILFFELMGYKKTAYHWTRLWSGFLLWFCCIKIKIKGEEHLPSDSFLLLFNHRSYVDILALLKAVPKRIHFGSKKVLFSIPLLGFAMRKTGHIPIDRKQRRKVYELYQSLKSRVQRGDCFVLSPEGGRNTGQGLAHFKSGPFAFAIQYQMNTFPVLIHKAQDCMPKGSWIFNKGAWCREVVVEYLPPISSKEVAKSDIKALKDKVYEVMEKGLKRYSSFRS